MGRAAQVGLAHVGELYGGGERETCLLIDEHKSGQVVCRPSAFSEQLSPSVRLHRCEAEVAVLVVVDHKLNPTVAKVADAVEEDHVAAAGARKGARHRARQRARRCAQRRRASEGEAQDELQHFLGKAVTVHTLLLITYLIGEKTPFFSHFTRVKHKSLTVAHSSSGADRHRGFRSSWQFRWPCPWRCRRMVWLLRRLRIRRWRRCLPPCLWPCLWASRPNTQCKAQWRRHRSARVQRFSLRWRIRWRLRAWSTWRVSQLQRCRSRWDSSSLSSHSPRTRARRS